MEYRTSIQAAYQRNMTRGMLLAIVLSLSLAIWLSFWPYVPESPPATIDRAIGNGPGDHGGDADTSMTTREGPSGAALLPTGAPRSGFLGFGVKVVPVNDRPGLSPCPPRLIAYNLDPDGAFQDVPSVGAVDADWLDLPGDGGAPEWLPESHATGEISRDVEVIKTVEPEYPRVAEMSGREGMVVIMVYIDVAGRLRPFSCRGTAKDGKAGLEFYRDLSPTDTLPAVVMYEDPKGWYFADKTVEAILQWSFAPAIRDGLPRGGFLEITYRFCLGLGCRALELRTLRLP